MANTTDVMNNPSIVEVGSWTFIIMDAPNDANLHLYLKICQEKKVTDIVRCCEKTYNTDPCTQAGIDVHVRLSAALRGVIPGPRTRTAAPSGLQRSPAALAAAPLHCHRVQCPC